MRSVVLSNVQAVLSLLVLHLVTLLPVLEVTVVLCRLCLCGRLVLVLSILELVLAKLCSIILQAHKPLLVLPVSLRRLLLQGHFVLSLVGLRLDSGLFLPLCLSCLSALLQHGVRVIEYLQGRTLRGVHDIPHVTYGIGKSSHHLHIPRASGIILIISLPLTLARSVLWHQSSEPTEEAAISLARVSIEISLSGLSRIENI